MKSVVDLKLSEFEAKVLKLLITTTSEEIKFIPLDIYYSILAYLESREDYENCVILRDLYPKVTEMSVDEYYKIFYEED